MFNYLNAFVKRYNLIIIKFFKNILLLNNI